MSTATLAAPRGFVVTERASSLRGCVEACAKQGAVPTCIGSEEENDLAAALLGRGELAFLGLYRSDTSGGADEGWARCVGGAAPGFTSWAAGQPDNWFGPEDCAVVTGQGEWWDWPCEPSAISWTAPRCLCAGPANASASFAPDLDALEATWAAHVREARSTVAVLYPIVAIVVLLPSLLFLCRRAVTVLLLRRRADAASSTSTHEEASHSASACARCMCAARLSAAQRRMQVSGAMGQAGWALLGLGLVPMIMFNSGNSIDAVVGPTAYWALLISSGASLLLLALLPTDARAIRAVCAGIFVVCLVFGALFASAALNYLQAGDLARALGLCLPVVLLLLAAAAALAPTLPCHGCRRVRIMEPRQALRRLWRVVRLLFAGLGVLAIVFYSAFLAIHPATANTPQVPGNLASGATFLLCAALATPANRGRLHRLLGRLGSRGSEEEEAAAVAALVGGADPAKALQRAAALFRCLPAKQLHAADLADNRGAPPTGPTLHERTMPARMGQVTAFLSHSWSDENEHPGAKFAALERWASRHEEATGEEPTLWLDQNDIDQSLACLPVFLAGCQKLLIVAGPTYTSRLWCVMEIFTFLHMGGGLERIDIHPLLASAAEGQSDRQATRDRLTAQFATFDAAKAQCFLNKDRQRLLAVIEAGFGDFKEFNTRVRAVFAQRVTKLSSRLAHRSTRVSAVFARFSSRQPTVLARFSSRQPMVALTAVDPVVVQEDGLHRSAAPLG